MPDWWFETMRDAFERMDRVTPYVEQAQQSMASALSHFQQYAEQAQQALDAAARSMEPIAEFMLRHAEQVQQALAVASLVYANFDRTALAMTAGMTAPMTWTASADLTATPALTVQAEIVEPTASRDVEAQPDTRPEARRPIDYPAMAIKLLWTWALVAPPYILLLPAEEQQLLTWWVLTITLALMITWRYNDKR